MSITDELRLFAADPYTGWVPTDKQQADLRAIADRIDAEHEALRDRLDTSERQKESYREDLLAANRQVHASYNDGFDDGFASADDWLAKHEDAMAEHGWVRLPKDADGVSIHIGDVMEWVRYGDDDPTIVRTVIGVGLEAFFAWSDEQGRYAQYEAHAYRHHRAPTVEDVLFDSLKHFGAVEERTPEVDKWLHEQAKRLTLAESEDA